jgi:hypothetical protein
MASTHNQGAYNSLAQGAYQAPTSAGPVTYEQTIISNTKVAVKSTPTIASNAKVAVKATKTITSNTKVWGTVEQPITSNAKVTTKLTKTIVSNTKVAGAGTTEQTIPSNTKVTVKTSKTLPANAKITVKGTKTITSNVKVTGSETANITSNTKVVVKANKTLTSNTKIVTSASSNITSNSKVVTRITSDITSNAKVTYVKDFYCRLRTQKDLEKDFYERLIVVQPAPVNPTSLVCTDLKTGEAMSLSWVGTNYGWNIYKYVGGTYVKQNLTVITENTYIVGELVTGVNYSFKVCGVNGIGIESSGVVVTGTPTYDITRYVKPIWVITVAGVPLTTAILDRVELCYGPAFSTASFHIQELPGTVGQPEATGQTVTVTVNGRLIFTGLLVKKTDIIKSSDLRVNYIAVSKLWEYTLETVDQDYNKREGKYIGAIDINKILTVSGCPAGLPVNYLYGEIPTADQTQLELMNSMLRYAGNYKIYTSPTGVVSYYKIGSPVSTRTYVLGKHIIEQELSDDITDKIDQVTVRSGPIAVTTWALLKGPGGKLWSGKVGDRTGLNSGVSMDRDGNLYMRVSIYGNGISGGSFEALVNDKPVAIEYLEGIEVLPSHVGLTTWPDGSTDGKMPVVKWTEFMPDWKSVSVQSDYEHYNSANYVIAPVPVRYVANIQRYTATFKIINSGTGLVEDTTMDVWLMLDPIEYVASVRQIYSYQGGKIEVTKGSGTVKRTLQDGVTPYSVSTPHSGMSNLGAVQTYINNRAQAEYDKLSFDQKGGSLTVLGDETIDLRMQVNELEVMRVIHDFSNGYFTHLDLTNEQFYQGDIVLGQRNTSEVREKVKKVEKSTFEFTYDLDRYNNIVGSANNKPTTTNNPKSGIGHYSD